MLILVVNSKKHVFGFSSWESLVICITAFAYSTYYSFLEFLDFSPPFFRSFS
uniref:Uncharacterized protein n=1 Tax=Rhizophora mucronata TaxID=61149 RepID=A0A2P2IYG3_RHIMU